MNEAQKKAGEGEMQTVLAQPHRRIWNGEAKSQLVESPLGQFCLRRHLRRELYDSGLAFGELHRKVLFARARPANIIAGPIEAKSKSTSDAPGLAPGKALYLQREFDRIKDALEKVDPVGFLALVDLCTYERQVTLDTEYIVAKLLYRLALLLGKLGHRRALSDDNVVVRDGRFAVHVSRAS